MNRLHPEIRILRRVWLTLAGVVGAVLFTVALPGASPLRAQEERLLDRISNEKLVTFERQLEVEIDSELRRYLAPGQYVLSVRVIWDQNLIPPTAGPILNQDKQKLPGFPIFVRTPGAPPDEQTPPFNRLVVKMLIDETLPDYYERFLRKIVPIVSRFVPDRGDQLIILMETFPELQREDLIPPLSEEELMNALGNPLSAPRARGGAAQQSAVERARLAYDEGRYAESLQIVRGAFQEAGNNRERAQYLGMEGSIQYTLNNPQAARAAWERALGYNPNDPDVRQVLNFLGRRPTESP